MTNSEIIAQIDAHMKRSGIPNSSWYVGIASAPEDRLFIDHKVDRDKGTWIYRQAASDTAARSVEDAYHAAGCDEAPEAETEPPRLFMLMSRQGPRLSDSLQAIESESEQAASRNADLASSLLEFWPSVGTGLFFIVVYG
jgi:hypothetical protein